MSEAILKARELGNSIIQSSEFASFEAAKAQLEASGLLNAALHYETACQVINSGKFKEDNRVYTDAKEIFDKFQDNEKIQAYIKSKKKLQRLLDEINAALRHITGMDTGISCSGCGGNCSGCGKQ